MTAELRPRLHHLIERAQARADLGRAIREARHELDWTQEKLAAAAGLCVVTIGRYEAGTRIVPDDYLARIIEAMKNNLESP